MTPIGIYIHIPFCVSKCAYCDFVSFAHQEENFLPYTEAIIQEIQSAQWLHEFQIKSIFFGGGTPSILPTKYLSRILEVVLQYNKDKQIEITTEANPGTLDKKTLEELKMAGFNRLSMGLQTDDPVILKKLGRIHTYECFLENYEMAKSIGFENINVDLMFSLPDQTMAHWTQTLRRIVALKPQHISAYSLIIEDDTTFGGLYEKNMLNLPDEITDREMYTFLRRFLHDHGYYQYEISNFSLPGRASVHNQIYWEREPYVGFGLAAHSFIHDKRYWNTSNLKDYLTKVDKKIEAETVSLAAAIEETIFLGLRMTKGINLDHFRNTFKKDLFDLYGAELRWLISEGYLSLQNNAIALTARGTDVSNLVFSKILAEDGQGVM